MRWKNFFMGLFVGVILSLAAVGVFVNRYRITHLPGVPAVKLDTWTGTSWLLRGVDGSLYWVEIKHE
jgi:hypothetical protein